MKKDEFILYPDKDPKNADWTKKTEDPEEILRGLRDKIFDPRLLPDGAATELGAYMDHLQATIWRLYTISIDTHGKTTRERAKKTVDELRRIGLLEEHGREHRR